MNSLIAYYRVSTQRQGHSGLGLEGQQSSVERFAASTGQTILAAYTEVESGKNNDRPQLRAAILHAKRSKATLCVAKLDRLSRNAKFLLELLEAKIPFVAVDNPTANELTIGLMAIIAQHEAKAISDRTRVALAAKKARGGKLGSARAGHWQGREHLRLAGAIKASKRSCEVRAKLAHQARDEIAPIIQAHQAAGLTLKLIAERLNLEGWTTRRGRPWTEGAVCRLLKGLKRAS